MDYKCLIRDFSKRTKKNLEIIRVEKNRGNEAYEVTQLINSMLGLLVFPQQSFINNIPETPIEELEEAGWPIPKVCGNYPQVKNLKQLIRFLRNGISHFNLEFISESGELSGLIIWNKNQSDEKTWEAELSLVELEAITNKFTELLLK